MKVRGFREKREKKKGVFGKILFLLTTMKVQKTLRAQKTESFGWLNSRALLIQKEWQEECL